MSYVESTLIKDEQVVYRGYLSAWSLTSYWVWGALCLFLGIVLHFLLLVAVVIGVMGFITYQSTELAITNKRVIAKFGFISRHTIEMNLAKVESIQVSQSVLGRIFNYGSLVVSGAGNPQAPIPGISDPMAFRKKAMEAQEQAK